MPKFLRDVCEVCGNPVIDVRKLRPDLQEKVYRPSSEESYNVEIELVEPKGFEATEIDEDEDNE